MIVFDCSDFLNMLSSFPMLEYNFYHRGNYKAWEKICQELFSGGVEFFRRFGNTRERHHHVGWVRRERRLLVERIFYTRRMLVL